MTVKLEYEHKETLNRNKQEIYFGKIGIVSEETRNYLHLLYVFFALTVAAELISHITAKVFLCSEFQFNCFLSNYQQRMKEYFHQKENSQKFFKKIEMQAFEINMNKKFYFYE